jgi:hypothetical protein
MTKLWHHYAFATFYFLMGCMFTYSMMSLK